MIPLQIKADKLIIDLKCPSTALSKANVSCTISAKGNNLSNIQGRYALTNATYKEFKFGSGWDIMPTVSNTGFLATRSSATSSNVVVGTLTITMPSSGSATIKLSNLNGGYSYIDSSEKLVIGDLDLVSSPSAIIRVSNTPSQLDINNKLSMISIKGYSISFDKNINTYNVIIKEEKELNINVIPESDKAQVTVIGNKNLENGSKIKIIVISESGDENEYIINIQKEDKVKKNKITKPSITLYVRAGVLIVVVLFCGLIALKKRKK